MEQLTWRNAIDGALEELLKEGVAGYGIVFEPNERNIIVNKAQFRHLEFHKRNSQKELPDPIEDILVFNDKRGWNEFVENRRQDVLYKRVPETVLTANLAEMCAAIAENDITQARWHLYETAAILLRLDDKLIEMQHDKHA